MAILVLLGLAVKAFFMGIASAHRELKISPYDSDIPTWLIALVSVITVGSIMLCFKRYFEGRLFSFIFLLVSSSVLVFILLNYCSQFVDSYFAFNGPSETSFRKIRLIGGELAGHKGVSLYNGVLNNDGFIAKPSIEEPLYRLIATSPTRLCVGVMVQRTRSNERILFSRNVLDVSDVVQC